MKDCIDIGEHNVMHSVKDKLKVKFGEKKNSNYFSYSWFLIKINLCLPVFILCIMT